MENKKFDIGTILSITTGKLLTEMGNIYKILNYMTGDNLYTHQLPRVSSEMKPVIIEQYPELADVDASGVNKGNWQKFLNEQINRFGERLEISPCGLFEHRHINPQEELEQTVDPSKIIIIPNIP